MSIYLLMRCRVHPHPSLTLPLHGVYPERDEILPLPLHGVYPERDEILPLPLRYPLLSQGQGQNDKRRRAQSQSFGSGQALASPLKGEEYYAGDKIPLFS